MAKWARRSGGQRRWRWICEPLSAKITPETPDPFDHVDSEAIRAALVVAEVATASKEENSDEPGP